jgi:CrcB protein
LLAPDGHQQRHQTEALLRIALLIAFGIAGTLARYGLQGFVQQRSGWAFPAGTLVVNLVACFLIGGIGEYALRHLAFAPEWRIAITTGFIGSFSTFSTFAYETAKQLEDGLWSRATTYLAASIVGGLVCVFAGIRLADRI